MATGRINQEWQDVFVSTQENELRANYRHNWTLRIDNNISPDLTSQQRSNGWKVYQTSSYGRFVCSSCRHSWNSARVSLIFHYHLEQSERGEVVLRLFRQQCRRCRKNLLITASFEEDKKEEVLMRLMNKIKKNCYHENIETIQYSREMKITKPHEASLCEACLIGKCNRNDEYS
ncbi:receptor-transporting protein 3-like [Pelodytes ibericus]